MPLNRTLSPARRLRAAQTPGRGGGSSLLRLSQAGSPQLPKGAALAEWIDRAASALGAKATRVPGFAPSEFHA